MSKNFVYISRWNEFVGEPGIALLDMNPETGELTFVESVEDKVTCNCTAIDKERNILYITNEVKENPDFTKGGGGLVLAYKVDPKTGKLDLISRVFACCPCPCYISIDPTGKYLVCANHSSYFAVTKAVQKEDGTWGMEVVYDDATVDLFELNEDGTIGNLVDVSKHTTLVKGFLLHCHPHSTVWEPNGKFFACCDKGDDRVYMYRIDYENKKLVLMGEPYQDGEKSMPRYCLFHPDPTKPFFFNNHEKNINLSSYRYDENGNLEHICSLAALPEGMEMPKATGFLPGQKPAQQAITISSDGKYIYDVLNGKGVDGISVFEVNQEDGTLKLLQYQRVDGVWARGVALSPDGKFLLITCLDDGGAVMSFAVKEDGTLEYTGSRIALPGASFATFFPVD